MQRKWKILVRVAVAAAGVLLLLRFAELIIFGSPVRYAASFFYQNLVPYEMPVQLNAGETLRFNVRTVEARRGYTLYLEVGFDNSNERAARSFIGGPGMSPPGVPTTFDVVARDSRGHIVHEVQFKAIGRTFTGAQDVGRAITTIWLDPGVYEIAVTLQEDLPALRDFKTSLRFSTRYK